MHLTSEQRKRLIYKIHSRAPKVARFLSLFLLPLNVKAKGGLEDHPVPLLYFTEKETEGPRQGTICPSS